MDPHAFFQASTEATAIPAPIWFVEFFKVLGFTLHAIPMSLWFAGLMIALGLHVRGCEQGKRFANRFMKQMPIIIAMGINLGIVPLLFIQLAYFRSFYPATILMAWPWISIIVILIPAYYGIYAYAWGLRANDGQLAAWRRSAGWIACGLFFVIGFIFSNGISLMDHAERWSDMFQNTQHAGAVLGIGLNYADGTLYPRFLVMFSLALGTTAVWILFDAYVLDRNASEEYRAWAWKKAKRVYTVALISFAATGSWYVFGSWTTELRETMFRWPTVLLTAATAVAMGGPWLLIFAEKSFKAKLPLVALISLAQVLVLGINATSRQVVQNVNISKYFDVLNQLTAVQWGPLVMFLAVFVLGLLVVVWMVAQIVNLPAKPAK